MLNWLKSKKKPAPEGEPLKQEPKKAEAQTREQVVATAMKNMQAARDQIGEEKLQKLAQLILQKKNNVDDTSPAAQAKKIIAQMDKDKLSDFMRLMVQDDQTKH